MHASVVCAALISILCAVPIGAKFDTVSGVNTGSVVRGRALLQFGGFSRSNVNFGRDGSSGNAGSTAEGRGPVKSSSTVFVAGRSAEGSSFSRTSTTESGAGGKVSSKGSKGESSNEFAGQQSSRGYSAPSRSFGAPDRSFGAPPRVPIAPVKIPKPPPRGVNVPTPSFGAPNRSFGGSNQSNGAPSRSFGAPDRSFGAPDRSFGAPEQPSRSFGAPDQSFGAPPRESSPPKEKPSPPKEEPAPPKEKPAPPKEEPSPPKDEPAPPKEKKEKPSPPKEEPAPPKEKKEKKEKPSPPKEEPSPPKEKPAPPAVETPMGVEDDASDRPKQSKGEKDLAKQMKEASGEKKGKQESSESSKKKPAPPASKFPAKRNVFSGSPAVSQGENNEGSVSTKVVRRIVITRKVKGIKGTRACVYGDGKLVEEKSSELLGDGYEVTSVVKTSADEFTVRTRSFTPGDSSDTKSIGPILPDDAKDLCDIDENELIGFEPKQTSTKKDELTFSDALIKLGDSKCSKKSKGKKDGCKGEIVQDYLKAFQQLKKQKQEG